MDTLDIEYSPRKQHSMRQVAVQRKNLVQVCRLSVKTLIDRSALEAIDDNAEELLNFCAIMEQLLSHRLKMHNTWYGITEPRFFWEYIKVACKNVPHNCIKNIEGMENIKTPRAKGRAWLRMVLMEKRLSEYLSAATKQAKITKSFYGDGAIMLSEDITMLCGVLLGLNAIDFSFCLKGEDLEIVPILAIDYTPYLNFVQSTDSIRSDEAEYRELSISSMEEVELQNEFEWRAKYQKLESKYKTTLEQKGYLEELSRLREDQLDDANRQKDKIMAVINQMETDARREQRQLENVILELQAQLSTSKEEILTLRKQVDDLVLKEEMRLPPGTEIAMTELPGGLQQKREHYGGDRHSESSSELSPPPSNLKGPNDSHSLLSMTSSRSIASATSAGATIAGKEDSQSLVPMAGSFTESMSEYHQDEPATKIIRLTKTPNTDQPIEMKEPASSNQNLASGHVIESVEEQAEERVAMTQQAEKIVADVTEKAREEFERVSSAEVKEKNVGNLNEAVVADVKMETGHSSPELEITGENSEISQDSKSKGQNEAETGNESESVPPNGASLKQMVQSTMSRSTDSEKSGKSGSKCGSDWEVVNPESGGSSTQTTPEKLSPPGSDHEHE